MFAPNWKTRGVLAPGIVPSLPADAVATGLLRLVWLKRLNDSARNWPWTRLSLNMSLNSEASTSTYPGPRRKLREVLPKVCNAAGTNAALLNRMVLGEPAGGAML